jgi:hypothetical protein
MGDFDTWEEYNFMWTQWKSNRIITGLKTHKEILSQEQQCESSGD